MNVEWRCKVDRMRLYILDRHAEEGGRGGTVPKDVARILLHTRIQPRDIKDVAKQENLDQSAI